MVDASITVLIRKVATHVLVTRATTLLEADVQVCETSYTVNFIPLPTAFEGQEEIPRARGRAGYFGNVW